jgi:ribonuclease VapC
MVDITAVIGRAAIDALRRYGRHRHRADLNMGDCFAYAYAKDLGVAMLCKGSDFVHTDIDLA